jgi:hypothetical protein
LAGGWLYNYSKSEWRENRQGWHLKVGWQVRLTEIKGAKEGLGLQKREPKVVYGSKSIN